MRSYRVAQLVEYAPSTDSQSLRLRTAEESARSDGPLTSAQEMALVKAHTLLGYNSSVQGQPHNLVKEDLRRAIHALTDEEPLDSILDSIMRVHSPFSSYMTFNEFKALSTSGELHPVHSGRYWVAVSLAEAETLRRVLHVRFSARTHARSDSAAVPEVLIPGARTELSLRYSPLCAAGAPKAGDGGVIVDITAGWAKNGSGATK